MVTTHTSGVTRLAGRAFLLIAAVLALALSTTMFAATARADAGEGTIGMRATNSSWNGTYQTPTAEGDQEGWCVDPGLPEPKANGNTDPYGEPVEWDAPDAKQKTQLIAALTLGEAASKAKASGVGSIDIPGIDQIVGTANADVLGAAVSGVVHKIGYDADPKPNANWDPAVLDPESRAVYDNILQFADKVPGLNTEVPLMIREPSGAGAGHQRMLLIGDVELPEIPKIEIPEIELPKLTLPNIEIPKIELPEAPAPTPEISTTATSSTGDIIEEGTTVVDTVAYRNVIPGEEYTLEASMMCKETNQVAAGTATKTFTPEEANGTIDVGPISLGDVDCYEQVVFEELRDSTGNVVAEHKDINDPAQTVGGEKPAEPGKIHVNKYDQDGKRLEGAKFEIRKGDKSGEVLYTWDTENDVMTFLVDAGDYTIIELSAPEGYEGTFEKTVTVDEGAEITLDVTNTKKEEPKPEPEPVTETVQAPPPTVTVTQAPPPAPEPVVEQPRATIVSVPSGPVGNEQLPTIK